MLAHARKALLSGLSPKENRQIPPLHHDWVYRLKQEMPDLEVIINGGIDCVATAQAHLQHVDGVMLGRAAYHSPWVLAECEQAFAGGQPPRDREAVLSELGEYLEMQAKAGVPVKRITRHVLGLFQGRPGARVWRRYISQNAHLDDGNVNILVDALKAVNEVKRLAGLQPDRSASGGG